MTRNLPLELPTSSCRKLHRRLMPLSGSGAQYRWLDDDNKLIRPPSAANTLYWLDFKGLLVLHLIVEPLLSHRCIFGPPDSSTLDPGIRSIFWQKLKSLKAGAVGLPKVFSLHALVSVEHWYDLQYLFLSQSLAHSTQSEIFWGRPLHCDGALLALRKFLGFLQSREQSSLTCLLRCCRPR